MLNVKEIARAVDLQQRSYRLLKWMADAVARGFIHFDTAHEYSSLLEAAEEWIRRHYKNISPDARPSHDDLSEFCALFSTYLEDSFVLVREPGQRLYSPRAHCFCPMCSWLIDAPNLKTRKPTSADKRRARQMRLTTVRTIAAEHDVVLLDDTVDAIVDDLDLRVTTSMVTYGRHLLRRLKGATVGPAVLVLWRGFAWTPEGSPRKEFELSADVILEKERHLRDVVLASVRAR